MHPLLNGRIRWALPFLVLLLSLSGLAHGADRLPLATYHGTLRMGSCPKGWDIQTARGTYALTPGVDHLILGTQATVQGWVYPHVSICDGHPWLRIRGLAPVRHAPVDIVPAAGAQALGLAKNRQLPELTLPTTPAQLPARLQRAHEIHVDYPHLRVKIVVFSPNPRPFARVLEGGLAQERAYLKGITIRYRMGSLQPGDRLRLHGVSTTYGSAESAMEAYAMAHS